MNRLSQIRIDPSVPSAPPVWRRGRRRHLLLGLMLLSAGSGTGWAASLAASQAAQEPAPLYQITVTPATATAISYRELSGATVIGLRGTVLLPGAAGRVKLRSRAGTMELRIKCEKLEPASRFGPEYLTYVLWAVTPAGHPVNLGELIVRPNGKAVLETRTHLQTFGLIVTAEPHFAVTRVSSVVVLENAVTRETRGRVEEVRARYELLPRSAYVLAGNPMDLPPTVGQDPRISPYVHQAANALRIARAEEADRYAPQAFQKAVASMGLLAAEKKPWKKPAIILARQTVQQSEDARMLTEQAKAEQARALEHQAAETARQEAAAAKAEVEAARAQSEAARQQALQEVARVQDQASRQTEQNREAAGAEQLARRQRLREQLSRLLETRDTEQGLVVSLSDLLFPSGKATLLPATREKLARVAGILLAYPGVRVAVEGHTDSTGAEAVNLRLSRRRAEAVRDCLIRQGLSPDAVAARGHGSGLARASNETVAGRQQNRRVELLLTGPGIGF